ncbi:Uncharacterised protein [Providencia rustigianii]|uniref:Uncharacterized protein n=2 Tax=Providencia rustigianii TaxID=158850 RepID=A0A379G283_9GAMM|nr:hypothetical protein [Providencia rustigianii]SUC35064.1 Uncharacterised protein [Providencia rustigianii]SUC35078.1 Uncharacterised protein [Providencia rustigianii]
MFKTGLIRGSIKSPTVRKSARFQVWERLDKEESLKSIKENPPLMQNGVATKDSNIDIEYSQWVTWSKRESVG